MVDQPETGLSWRQGLLLWIGASLLFGAMHAGIDGLADHDGYYHAKIALLMGHEPLAAPGFRWTTISIWAEGYADKEWLFHVALLPFAQLGQWLGGLDGALVGVKVAAALLAGGVLWALAALIARGGGRAPGWWLLVAVAIGAPMLLRLVCVRAHVLSALLLLLAIEAQLAGARWRLLLIAVLYTLGYTAAHALPIALLVAAAGGWIGGRRPRLDLQAAGVGGVGLGLLLHPHFPTNVSIWRVQNVSLWEVAKLSQDSPELARDFARELAAVTPAQLASQYGLLLALTALAIGALAWTRRRPSPEALAVGALAVAFGALNLGANRFAEYWTPFTAAAAALWLRDALAASPALEARWRALRPTALALTALLALIAVHKTMAVVYRLDHAAQRPVARWLAEHSAPDEVVFHPDFLQFPRLFYGNHHNRYLVGLDPIFAFAADEARCLRYLAIGHGEVEDPVAAIRALGCRWIVISGRRKLSAQLEAAVAEGRLRRAERFELPVIRRRYAELPLLRRTFAARQRSHRVTTVYALR